MIMDHPLYPVTAPREERMLKVSDNHSLHYSVYGNPNGTPVVVLHGGPGAGCDDSLTKFFDLTKWNVVMFDQRGAMKSIPFACMEENTPQHSIRDIEMLREHLGIDKWAVFGGSWGSALALLYGQAHPNRCTGFMLRGIFLGREPDYLHLIYGMGKLFPEAYAPFVNYIPENERGDLLKAYYLRVMDPDPAVHMPAAKTFMRYDLLCSTYTPNLEVVEKVLKNDRMILSITRVYFYYSMNRFFLEPDQILSNMHLIDHLPAIIVQGSGDLICLPEMATLLHQKWSKSQLWMIPSGGHSANNDPAIASAVAASTDAFAEKINN